MKLITSITYSLFLFVQIGLGQNASEVTSENADPIHLDSYLPLNALDYRSYMGEVTTDNAAAEVHLREEVSSNLFINNRRTYRSAFKTNTSLSNESELIEGLNTNLFQTSHNGWLIFREETNGKIIDYKYPAKILPSEPEIGKSYKYKVGNKPDSGVNAVINYHTVVEGIEPITLRNGQYEALKVNQEKRIKIASDKKMRDVTYYATEYRSFWLVKGIGIAKRETTITSVSDDNSSNQITKFELVASNSLPNYLWPESEYDENGWKLVNWFGHITDQYFPWIYHHEHGWLWVDAKDTSDIKLWSESLGWWITSEALYPTFYSMELQEWLTYTNSENKIRSFVRSDGTLVTASLTGFSFKSSNTRPPASEADSIASASNEQVFYDSRGNRYTNSEGGIVSDTGSLPEVELLAPFEGTRVDEDEKFLILADAFDSDGVIMQVKILVNGKVIEVLEDEPYQTSMIADGEDDVYNIQAVATDNDGNTVQSSVRTVQVSVENQFPPEIRVFSPINRSVLITGSWVTVELKASDADGFVESVTLLVDKIPVGDPITRPPYIFGFRPPVDGNYQIAGQAIDDDKNISVSSSISITTTQSGIPESEEIFPEVRISSPLNRSTHSLESAISVEAIAGDEDGFVQWVKILVDGVQIGEDLTQYPYSISYTPPTTGSYKISAVARDNSRNQTTSASITITVD